MARVQVGYDPRAEALQTTAAPELKTVQAGFDPRSSTAFQLAEALGKASPVIDKFNEDYDRQKLQEQLLKQDAYRAQFAGSRDNVSATQVGTQFPETNPIVRARIAESIGVDYGKTLVAPLIDQVNKDDSIRLDSTRRVDFLKQKRDEIVGGLKGDDFFKAGAVRALDAEIDAYHRTWQTQTAAYHQEVQKKQFGDEVTSAFAQTDPKQALLDLDQKWGQSSSLNNIERNKLVIEQAVKLAFVADNPALLDQIPQRFLNNDSKKEIADMKIRIQERRITNFRNTPYIQQQQREEETRGAKLEIIESFVSGKPIDDAKYMKNPEAYAYAMSMKDAGRIPDHISAASAQQVRAAVINSSTVSGLDPKKATDQILANPALNPKEKQALIQELPKLLEGTIAMQDPMVKSALDTRVEARLKALEGSTNARIQTLLSGRNLRGEVMRSFDVGIRNGFMTYYEDNKNWPTGRAKQEIVDRETDKAEKLLESLTSIQSLQQNNAAPARGASAPAPSRSVSGAITPAPAAQPAPTQADIDFAKANPQFRQRFIDRFGREP